MKLVFVALILFSTQPALGQKAPEGLWQGYDGEWFHVTQQLVALAEATPEEKFTWRPATGVRSTSEVYMHIVLASHAGISDKLNGRGSVSEWDSHGSAGKGEEPNAPTLFPGCGESLDW